MSHEGVKETKEAIKALVILGKFVALRAKDGIDLEDLSALVTKIVSDSEFKNALAAGISGLDKVPAEIGDLDFNEVLDLATLIPDVLSIIKA